MAEDKEAVLKLKTVKEGDGIVKTTKELEKLGDQAKKTTTMAQEGISSATEKVVLWSQALNILKTAWSVAGKAANWLWESIEMANKNARAVNMLSAAYQNVGYTAEGALKQARAFASEMQNLTGIADEAFLDAQRLLANYGVVGAKAQEGIRAAYALSVSQGMSFESALMQIAKAAAGSTAALSRYGIVLGDNVKDGEKFDAVLKQINDRFGASAQAAIGDMTAQVGSLKESWGDLREELGNYLIPAFQKLVNWGKSAIDVLNNIFSKEKTADQIAYEKNLFRIAEINKEIAKQNDRLNSRWFNHAMAQQRIDALNKEKALLQSAQEQFEKRSYKEAQVAKVQEEQAEKQAAQINNARTINNIAEDRAKKETEILAKVREQAAAAQAQAAQTTREQTVKFSADYSNMSGGDLVEASIKLDNERALQEQIAQIRKEGLDKQLADARTAFEQSNADELNANATKYENALVQLEEFNAQQLEQQQTYAAQREAMEQNLINFNQNAAKAYAKTQTQNFKNAQALFTQIGQLATSENKKLAAVGKAGAIAQATINTYEGATKALAQGGFYGIAMAAAVIAAGLAQVAQISSVKLADGGLVKAVTGGVPAVVGEGGSDEAVLPLDNANAMRRIGGAIAEESGAVGGVTVNINVQAVGGVEAILEQLTDASRNGVVQALEFANLNYKVGAQQQGYSV